MDAEVPFADAKRDDTQTPASVDAMPETDCNSTTKESAIHEANDCAPQFARVDEKDHNTGSGSELPYVKCAVIGVASPEENFPPCTIDKILEIMTTEAPLSAPADTEASDKAAVVSLCEATSGDSSERIQEESTLSSRKQAPEGHIQMDAEQKPLPLLNQGPDGLSLEHTEKPVDAQDLALRTSSDTCHLKQETSIELSKEGNSDVELATDPARNEAIHTEVSTTDSSISGDAFLKSIPESSLSVATQFEDTSLAVNQRGEVEDANVAELSGDKQLKDVPVSFSSPAVPPSSSNVEVASSNLSLSTSSSDVGSSERNQALDITADSKLPSKVASSDCEDSSEDGVCVEGAEDLSILSVTAKAAPGSDLEGGHEAAAGSLDCAGHISTGSDQENIDEECEMHPQLSRDYTDDDNGIDEGTRGLEDGLDDGLDEEEDEDCLKGERQQGDGEESVDPSNIQDKVLDFDEDKRNPQYIPKKGAFYQHDDRMVGDEDGSEVLEEKNEDDKGSRRQKKLWHDEGVWGHDMYREEEQGPKTSAELVSIYGYDIRTETMPPRARRRRRYGRGPNKYQRNWEDEEAYTPRSGSGRGGVRGGVRGGRRTRGGSHIGNPPFNDEDFPDLNVKPLNSEKPVTVQQDGAEEKQSARPTVFKGSDSALNSSSHQEEWDHAVKGSGMTHRGWGKRPSQPRRVPDALPRQQDSDVKENVSLAHRISRPGSRSPVKANEPPHNLPSTGRNRAVRHLLTEHERNKKDFEALEKLASKVELDDGDAVDLKRSTAATVTPRGGPVGSTESAAKPKRYSSLRLRPLAEAASYTETAVVTPQLPNTQAPLPAPNQQQPAILAAAPFPGPYAPYPDGYMLPPGQPPTVMPAPNQPPPVMTAPSPLTSSFLPPPTSIVSFPPQYPPPYTFPAQYAAPAPSAAPPTQTQAQKPPYYHGDIIYYNTQSQQHKQRPTPPRRPKAAIPIVPPPDSQSTAQESTPEPDGLASHQNKSDEDLDNVGGPKPTLQDGPTAQQAVGGL